MRNAILAADEHPEMLHEIVTPNDIRQFSKNEDDLRMVLQPFLHRDR